MGSPRMESHGLILALNILAFGIVGEVKLNKAPRMQTGLPDKRRTILISLIRTARCGLTTERSAFAHRKLLRFRGVWKASPTSL